MNIVNNIKNAISWINNNSTDNYVYITSRQKQPYPEVSGYFIPTLKSLGFLDKAKKFSDYLCERQNKDGSWGLGGVGFVFDTAQVIDGLSEFGEDYLDVMNKGYNWILSKYNNGRFYDDNLGHGEIPEAFNFRTLWPLYKAGFDISPFQEFCDVVDPYTFDGNSHFYGYAFEGMARLNRDIVPFIEKIKSYNGLIPARKSTPNEYCYTGLSQCAMTLFICNQMHMAFRCLEFVTEFQNPSGGFYGGSSGSGYFIDEEPSWCVKFYLDAYIESMNSCARLEISKRAQEFDLGLDDPRFQFIRSNINEHHKVLDVGCGGGRYINHLNCERYACDLAKNDFVNAQFSIGSCSNLPFKDSQFDVVICCECLEHVVLKEHAIQQMMRVLKPSGKLLIIDKHIHDQPKYARDLSYAEEWVDFDYIKSKFNAKIINIFHQSFAMPFYGAEITK